MADQKTQRVHVPLTDEELEEIEEWRFNERMPSRAEAIRQLIKLGMTVPTKRQPKPR